MAHLYKAGTYSASAKGMKNPVKVNLTVDADKIVKENVDLGKNTKGYTKVADKLAQEIVKKQTSDVDAVSGASVTSRAVRVATRKAINDATITPQENNLTLKDGVFKGSGLGHGGPIQVAVTCKDNKIADVKVVKQSESPNVGDYAMKRIPSEIVKQQTLDVDAITGATMTSEAVLTGANRAIAKAGDAIAWNLQPYKKELPPTQNINADVVIAGAGLSGLSTAAFAVKRGLKTVVLEKNDQIGGSFRYAAGAFATSGSKALQKINRENNLDKLVNWVKELNEHNSKRPINLDFVKYLASKSGKTFDELLKIARAKPNFFLKMPYIAAGYAPGGKVAEDIEKYILKNGGKIIRSTVITKININGNRATGVEAQNASGKFTVTAKNVVIATGGASFGKRSMLEKNTPTLKNVRVFNEANRGNTGDGYDLLEQVGAQTYGNDVYKNAELDFDPRLHINYNNEPDYSKAIIINADGKRFTNEAPFSFLNLTTELYREGSSKYYLIYNAKTLDSTFRKQLDQLPEGPTTMAHADSIKELAKKINLDPATVQTTFDNYQKACDQGKDEFGKSKDNLVKFDGSEGYYAVYVMPGSWGTIGGVKINRKMQVEKADGSYFDNLYAVGEMSTGELFSDFYMIGFSLADYSTEGRLVAENLD
ncbi:FAD-dependent oxidoreductase [Lactobacillus acetotolerans]|uniref:FAD-dependent oxidoreductase n=1 Tax=Lactobacillus acetotolerans TaxID=1600 RepID=UPI001451F07B|nr:FAD-dependent oxidoreductase [Lactobacillus acetotolerans]QJD73527.1 FAD-dependent oxidoreductase [Lactobacillus acetotolerans]